MRLCVSTCTSFLPEGASESGGRKIREREGGKEGEPWREREREKKERGRETESGCSCVKARGIHESES